LPLPLLLPCAACFAEICFGMSPAARARISAGVWHELPGRSKFDGLIA
jgi:hypothetical protein